MTSFVRPPSADLGNILVLEVSWLDAMPPSLSIAKSLPALLLSRPRRQVIENKKSQTITIEAAQGQKPPYFVTSCDDCHLDFQNLSGLAQITIEDCRGLMISLCPVIASIDLVGSKNMEIEITQSRGTVCVDMSNNIALCFGVVTEGITIFSSSSEDIVVKADLQKDYRLPILNEEQSKRARYKTWVQDGQWRTAECDVYGDVLETQSSS